MDPESCYLGFEVQLEGETDQAAIEDAFEFVRDDCQLRILPPGAPRAAWQALIEALPEGAERAAELVAEAGAGIPAEEAPTPAAPPAAGAAPTAPQPAASPAAAKPAEKPADKGAAKGGGGSGGGTLRVDAGRLDQLINLVGELVIAVAGTDVLARLNGDEGLRESAEGMSRLVEEIRDTSLRLRMVPIGETFRRFQRVVRDGARDLGKQIELVTYGADTELDKVVSERISDPLMHLVRNAMDHGLETPEVRLAAGKPAAGTIQLEAYYDSGSIVIEINDDGAGLNAERIAAKAVERGLIEAGQTLTDAEIHRLIFEAGFSTAEQVSNLSGRGVGMDVVRRNIEALRGTVDVESTPGEGSTFRIRLPLTLSIIDGFLLKVGETSYVIPLEMLVECIEVGDEECRITDAHDYLDLRGEVLPFLRMGEVFAADGSGRGRENIVVVQYGETKAGLVVDELMGETQAVIKPLGALFQRLRGISGATILGSGEVALILDVPGLVQRAMDAGIGGEQQRIH
ncbi:chemotaxis protein CheA [Endothiovibrio diazotrophicus]